MARPLRIQYEGALYHITSRGNEKRDIFLDEADFKKFLKILSELQDRFKIIIYGYVLMNNHYHLLIETPQANIIKTIHYLNSSYTGYFNRKYNRVGHLFQGRYKSYLIEKDSYLLLVSRYIHLNPLRAGVVRDLGEYMWSSYNDYMSKRKEKEWLNRKWILSQFSNREDASIKAYKKFVEDKEGLNESPFKRAIAGFILGSEEFLKKIRDESGERRDREIPEIRKIRKFLGIQDIVEIVARILNIEIDEIKRKCKRNNNAKKICFYLIRRHTSFSNQKIGDYFGVGYTGVSQGVRRLKENMEEDKELKETVLLVEEKLLSEE